MQKNRDDLLSAITQGIIDKTLTDSDWAIANKRAKEFHEERERKEKQSREEHEKHIAERNLPENAFPRLIAVIHVKENRQELFDYATTYDLSALEKYADELTLGQHRNDFRNPTNALMIIRELINNRRKNATEKTPLYGNQYFIDAKKELVETKEMFKQTQEKLEETKKATEELKKQIEGNPERQKAYSV